uniref:Uncharacterized protein n=1 Tax=uncultured marine virus TaxID=186617 RepID=A0A0F7L726_9VIRU|nr:hypothetical protein [uncultured marine virus]
MTYPIAVRSPTTTSSPLPANRMDSGFSSKNHLGRVCRRILAVAGQSHPPPRDFRAAAWLTGWQGTPAVIPSMEGYSRGSLTSLNLSTLGQCFAKTF